MFVPPLYNWPRKSLWKDKASRAHKWRTFSAYFHYPFCRHLCDFCGYETRLSKGGRTKAFADRLSAELKSYPGADDFADSSLNAVFFGGGTASLMPEKLLCKSLYNLRMAVGAKEICETTLECEPGTITWRKLKAVREGGVNRISICAQAMDDETLKSIDRKHTTRDSLILLNDSLRAGFDNLHMDLMYNIEGQSLRSWEDALRTVVNLPVNHLSIYKLYVFKHGQLHRRGYLRGLEESFAEIRRAREMHDLAHQILNTAGFSQYSLTEYARLGRESKYIKSCFNGDDILPIGPGAFGRCGGENWENTPLINEYISSCERPSARVKRLLAAEVFKRDVILGVWLLSVDIARLAIKHSVVISEELDDLIAALGDEGLIDVSFNRIELNERQRFGAGTVMARLDSLPTSRWARDTVDDSASVVIIPTLDTCNDGGFAQLARVARRDRELFTALRDEPASTLEALGYDRSEPCVRALIDAIEANRFGAPSAHGGEVDWLWTSIANEHLR